MDDPNLARLRTLEFPHVLGRGYLNAASIGPMPERARVAADRYNQMRSRVHEMTDEDFTAPSIRARELCARLIGARPSEIALGANTSFGINLVALGLDCPTGSTVLVSDCEFPANVYPWMLQERLRFEQLPVDANGWPDEERMLERVRDPGVAVLSISSVQFSNGFRADLDRLGAACRESDTLFVVDGIQSLGTLPVDVSRTPIDVFAAGGHKWLCGPLGTGFTYVRYEVQHRIRPVNIGWLSMEASREIDQLLDYGDDFLPDARRYEVGTQPLQGHAALASAIEVLLEAGIESIERHVDGLLQPVRERLAEHPDIRCISSDAPGRRSPILAFVPPDPEAALGSLREAGLTVSFREGAIRIAPHIYNTESEIDRVLAVMEGWG